jgi:hypothetical protein
MTRVGVLIFRGVVPHRLLTEAIDNIYGAKSGHRTTHRQCSVLFGLFQQLLRFRTRLCGTDPRAWRTQSRVEACLAALPFAGVASWLPAADGIFQSRQELTRQCREGHHHGI